MYIVYSPPQHSEPSFIQKVGIGTRKKEKSISISWKTRLSDSQTEREREREGEEDILTKLKSWQDFKEPRRNYVDVFFFFFFSERKYRMTQKNDNLFLGPHRYKHALHHLIAFVPLYVRFSFSGTTCSSVHAAYCTCMYYVGTALFVKDPFFLQDVIIGISKKFNMIKLAAKISFCTRNVTDLEIPTGLLNLRA